MPLTRDDVEVELIVGMEVHVELSTRTKMWTAAPNVAHPDHHDAGPNTLLDPVVIGMPGTLPVMNRAAVERSMLVGLALQCTIARRSKWDRKSYYYPDLPKNYQISQYDRPLCEHGVMDVESEGVSRRVRIRRAHLEEDAGKLLHEAPGGLRIEHSIVDLNRAGTPLLEIVTEPDLRSAAEAVAFAEQLRDLVRHLGVSEAVMQRGHIRFEPNINLHLTPRKGPDAGKTFKTPIVEVKNLNSFKAVAGAIAHERVRQLDAWLDTGRTLDGGSKSTRGWDDAAGVTVLQREKEEAHDYRYFPDPDLVEVVVDDAWLERVKLQLPEPPAVARKRYVDEHGLDPRQVDQIMAEPAVARYFAAVLAEGVEPKRAAALLLNTLARLANERGVRADELGITPRQVKGVEDLIAGGKVSSNAAATLVEACCVEENRAVEPGTLAEKLGLVQVSDASALEAFVDQVLADPRNARAVADLRAGKDKAIGALMGQVMKLSGGKANPRVVTDVIKSRLG